MTLAFRSHRLGRVATALLVTAAFAAVFAVHARWIFTHFSSDGYLCDSGWFAFLFEHGGPLLRNPTAVAGHACGGVNQPSYLANHLAPHIFLFGAPFGAALSLVWLRDFRVPPRPVLRALLHVARAPGPGRKATCRPQPRVRDCGGGRDPGQRAFPSRGIPPLRDCDDGADVAGDGRPVERPSPHLRRLPGLAAAGSRGRWLVCGVRVPCVCRHRARTAWAAYAA